MKYIKSIFNVEENLGDSKMLVYNMLTQSYFIYDSVELGGEWKDISNHSFMKSLIDGKFLVSENFDEKEYILENFNKINQHNKELDIILVITTGCNMNCVYCYEEGVTICALTDEMLEKAISWMNFQINRNNVDFVKILLFGGEPLLIPTRTLEIMEKINNGVKCKILYSVATNGINLNSTIAEKMYNQGLRSLQVPIDGPKEIHEKRRPLKKDFENGGNFYRILNNLREIEREKIETTIKINIDKENIDYMDMVLSELENYNLKENTEIKFEAIALTNASTEKKGHYCNRYAYNSREPEMAIAYDTCIRLAEKRGFVLSKTIGNITPCMYSARNKFVINSDGRIYKCISAVGLDEFCIGNVESYEMSKQYYRNLMRIELSKICLEKGCPYVPKCGGGCAYEALIKEKNIDGLDCKYNYFKEYYKRKFLNKYQK